MSLILLCEQSHKALLLSNESRSLLSLEIPSVVCYTGTTMRICFLDLDGVVNSQPWLGNSEDLRREAWSAQSLLCPRPKDETRREYDLSHINPENVSRLNEIVEQADCHIVISSAWRILHTKDEIASLLAEKGFKFPERIIDMTDTGPGIRGTQIQRWLLAHEGEIEGMCIIDDDSDMDPFMPWLVKTNFFGGGLLKKHVQFAVNLLLEKFDPASKPQRVFPKP